MPTFRINVRQSITRRVGSSEPWYFSRPSSTQRPLPSKAANTLLICPISCLDGLPGDFDASGCYFTKS